eukprot:scaffold8828_cov204-Amphora_coffeaeformis.AAC.41
MAVLEISIGQESNHIDDVSVVVSVMIQDDVYIMPRQSLEIPLSVFVRRRRRRIHTPLVSHPHHRHALRGERCGTNQLIYSQGAGYPN